jgi:hypothetical protein
MRAAELFMEFFLMWNCRLEMKERRGVEAREARILSGFLWV